MKRIFAGLLVLFMVALCGCGGSGGGSTDGAAGAATAKRTTILNPNPDSPVYLVDYSPDGTGIVARRGASGEISKLDIVEPGGTYYQLTLGSAGLSEIYIGGYLVTVASTDASNNVTGITVKDPSGVVTSYGAPGLGRRSLALYSVEESACANPDGTVGLEDSNFPKTYGCIIALKARDATWTTLTSLTNFVVNKTADVSNKLAPLKDMLTRLKDSLSAEKVDSQLNELATKLNDKQSIIDRQENVMFYTEPLIQSGTDESFARNLIADARKLGNNQKESDLSTIEPSQLKLLSGQAVNAPPAATRLPAPIVTATLSPSLFGSFTLSWDAVPGADRYFIYQHKTTPPVVDVTKFGQDTTISPITTNSFHGQNLLGGSYYFVVVAVRDNPAQPLEPQMGMPSAPVNLIVDGSTPLTGTPAAPGTMVLSEPFYNYSKYVFDATPAFSQSWPLAQLGMSQSQLTWDATQAADGTPATQGTEPPSLNGLDGVWIYVLEIGGVNPDNTDDIALKIAGAHGGTLAPTGGLAGMSGTTLCHVHGENPQGAPTCASLGITFDRRGGTLSFQNTAMTGGGLNGVGDTVVKELTLSFTPF